MASTSNTSKGNRFQILGLLSQHLVFHDQFAMFAPEAFIPPHTSGAILFMPVRSLAGMCLAVLTGTLPAHEVLP